MKKRRKLSIASVIISPQAPESPTQKGFEIEPKLPMTTNKASENTDFHYSHDVSGAQDGKLANGASELSQKRLE
jgi:hypothetical protein